MPEPARLERRVMDISVRDRTAGANTEHHRASEIELAPQSMSSRMPHRRARVASSAAQNSTIFGFCCRHFLTQASSP